MQSGAGDEACSKRRYERGRSSTVVYRIEPGQTRGEPARCTLASRVSALGVRAGAESPPYARAPGGFGTGAATGVPGILSTRTHEHVCEQHSGRTDMRYDSSA